jgi:hypothetical protein
MSDLEKSITIWGEAEKEKWKAVQKAIPLTDKLGKFIGKIVGPAAFELGGLLGDQMKAWRAANLDRLERKWRAKLAQRKISDDVIRSLPFKEAVLMIEASSMEDDEDVIDLWARLLINATDVNTSCEIKKMHVDILKSLNGLEARILSVIFVLFEYGDFSSDKLTLNLIHKWPKMTSEQLRIALQNIQRLGLLTTDIGEHNILNFQTYEEWEKSVTRDNIVDVLKEIIPRLIMEISNYSGNPMNDLSVPNTPESYLDLIKTYTLTRIGFDLFDALRVNVAE